MNVEEDRALAKKQVLKKAQELGWRLPKNFFSDLLARPVTPFTVILTPRKSKLLISLGFFILGGVKLQKLVLSG